MGCRKEQPKRTYQTLAVPLVQIIYFCVALLQQLGQVPLVCGESLYLQQAGAQSRESP